MHDYRKGVYEDWLETYGADDPRAVGWTNEEALKKRFDLTEEMLDLKSNKGILEILDYGCGVSLNLLKHVDIPKPFRYVGVDCMLSSLEVASRNFNIPITKRLSATLDKQLITEENFNTTYGDKYDCIVVQGVYQEFQNIVNVANHIQYLSSTKLRKNGMFLLMTPSNYTVDFGGNAVLRLSPHDLVSVAQSTRLPFDLTMGRLGEHMVLRIYNKEYGV